MQAGLYGLTEIPDRFSTDFDDAGRRRSRNVRGCPIRPHFPTAPEEFTADDIVFFAGRDDRTLDQALEDADLLVSCPHSGYRIPEELAPFLAPEFTRRLQFDFTDMSTGPIVRRWAGGDVHRGGRPWARRLRTDPRWPARPDDGVGADARA